MNPELSAKMQLYREKASAGSLTREEMREIIVLLQEGRVQAAATSAKSGVRKTAAKAKANIDSDGLLGELEDL
jgi:hypothetical protein